MTYAIVSKPELVVVSMSDHRTDSERFLDFAKETGIDEKDPSLVRLLKALGATEKWQAGTMTEYLEIAFIEFELEAAFKEFGEAHENKWLSGLPCIGIRVVGFDDLPQINQRCLFSERHLQTHAVCRVDSGLDCRSTILPPHHSLCRFSEGRDPGFSKPFPLRFPLSPNRV